jgi:patatin-like phospholipase/acyl hydrolase
MKNILSIDGGGVRSFIPLKILNVIEKKTQIPISALFDYFSGVSAGSIVTALLLLKDENGTQKYTTDQMLELFEKFTKSVFYYSYVDRVMSGFGLLGPKYSNDYLEKALIEYFGSIQLTDLAKPVCFISYDLNSSKPCYFCTKYTPNDNVVDCLLASTAAPTYFGPYEKDSRLFIDGGVVTNNPCEVCFLKALQYKRQNYFTLSLATGYSANKSKWNYGLFGWSLNIVDVLFDANETAQSNDLELLQTVMSEENKFIRINIPLDDSILLDDVYAFPKMNQIMDKWIQENDQLITELCEQLILNYNSEKV